jgi:hypothetical protein
MRAITLLPTILQNLFLYSVIEEVDVTTAATNMKAAISIKAKVLSMMNWLFNESSICSEFLCASHPPQM